MSIDLLNQLMATPSLEQAPPDLTGSAATRPFTHAQIVQKHGLGNILSILGDVALSQMGLPAQYLPKVAAAKDADAMEGFDQDPIAAINRLNVIDPQRADSLRNDLYRNLYNQQLARTSAAAQAKDEASLPGIQADSRAKVFTSVAGLVNAPGAKKNWPAVRALADKTLRNNGLTDLADLLPTDPAGAADWATGAITPDKQVDNVRADKQLGLNEENVHSEIANRQTMAGIAGMNAGTNAKNANTREQEVNDMISFRAWQKQHGDKGDQIKVDNAEQRKKYQQWLMDHPSKGRVSAPKAGDVIDGYRFKGGNPADKNNYEKVS